MKKIQAGDSFTVKSNSDIGYVGMSGEVTEVQEIASRSTPNGKTNPEYYVIGTVDGREGVLFDASEVEVRHS